MTTKQTKLLFKTKPYHKSKKTHIGQGGQGQEGTKKEDSNSGQP